MSGTAGTSGTSGEPPDKTPTMDHDGFSVPLKIKRGRGRPRKNADGVSIISTENSFDGLTDDDQGDVRQVWKKNRPTKEKRPPPLFIPNLKTRNDVEAILKDVPVDTKKVLRRSTKDGTKLFVSSNEDFKLLRTHFESRKVQFTSFTLHEDMVTRYVMYGLPKYNTTEVKEGILESLKFAPMEVKEMKIKEKSYDDQANYLVYFKKASGVTLTQLKSITGVLGYRVNFSKYHKGSQPTQCYNCQRFSHASANCWLDPRCMRCGGPHKSSECTLVDETTKKVPDAQVKCINCKGNHTSNSKVCPTRIKLMKDRMELNNRRQNTAKQGRYVQNFTNNYNSQFPAMNNFDNRTTARDATDSAQLPYSKVLTQPTQPVRNSNSAFTPSQLMAIFREMIHICSSLQSAEQQLTALTAIVEKYLCHD